MSQIEPNKEFSGPSHLSDVDRRDFLKYMGLFSTMSFLSSCTRPAENILPMPREFEEYSTRSYEYYTSAVPSEGFAQGIRIKCFEGRPIKVEGNAEHAYSLGATTAIAQAILYDLYHPGRNQSVKWKGKDQKIKDLKKLLPELTKNWKDGREVGFIFPALHSPHMIGLIQKLQKKYPASSWVSLSPSKCTSWSQIESLDQDVVVSFEEDAFFARPDALKLSREFMKKREEAISRNDKSSLNELWVYESSPTLMGAKADYRISLTRAEVWNNALDLFNLLSGKNVSNDRMHELSKRLRKKSGIVFIDPSLDARAQDLEDAINKLLKAKTKRNYFSLPETLDELAFMDQLQKKKIKTLIILDSDPYYLRPDLVPLLDGVSEKVSLSFFPHMSFDKSEIKIALSHALEGWSDLRSVDGNVSIIQPMIKPIYDSVTIPDFLNLLLGETKDSLTQLKDRYQMKWSQGLQKGFISDTVPMVSKVDQSFKKKEILTSFTLKLKPDSLIGYGENINNPILQELPKPFSKLTWSNAFYLSPEDATILKVSTGYLIKVKSGTVTVKGPVWVLPGVSQKTIVATLGYGQDHGTFIGKKRGFSAFGLQPDSAITVEKAWGHVELASTHGFQMLPEHHSPVKRGHLPQPPKEPKVKLASLYPDNPIPEQTVGPQWGMTIDLTICIGCQSCVSACQVENNIPFVGEEQVKKDRILHWLRIDTYFLDGQAMFQPVPCMHCEKAPCEVVCPVNATVHGNGGLNEMVYNRCVGTRYCSNNCPYKVRRFNFKTYSNIKRPWNMGFNPEVSVRERGVMEKCTYCIQRIKTGENKTACQTVCPTNAIEFGNIKDETSAVARNKNQNRNYDLLEDEGAVPRTSYLKVIRHET